VPGLRIQALRSLRGRASDEARAALVSFLGDDDPSVVAAAKKEIGARPAGEGRDLAAAVASLRSEAARRAGLRALLARGEDLTPFAADKSPVLRARALHSARVAAPAIETCVRDKHELVRAHAIERIGTKAAAVSSATDRYVEMRIAATRITTDSAVLVRLLGDRSWRVRLAAMLAAERVRHRDLVPALIDALRWPPGRVRARCAATLESLTGASCGDDESRWRRWWKSAEPSFRVRDAAAPRRKGGSVSVLSFRRVPVVSRRLVFVIDASRSMAEPAPHKAGKRRWDLVVSDLVGVLRRLPKDARFNVILFRTDVAAWRPRLVRATPGNVRRCEEWINKQSPAGWTNLFDAIELALRDDDVDALYVLTDGVPSRGAETVRRSLLDEVSFLNHYRMVQINCVQAGSSQGLGPRWRGFLDDLAQAHDGLSVRE
jgi:Mg-chelatase subunit ChlD